MIYLQIFLLWAALKTLYGLSTTENVSIKATLCTRGIPFGQDLAEAKSKSGNAEDGFLCGALREGF